MPFCVPPRWQSLDSFWFALRPPGPPTPHWHTQTSPAVGTDAGRAGLAVGGCVVVAAGVAAGSGGAATGAGFTAPPARPHSTPRAMGAPATSAPGRIPRSIYFPLPPWGL